MNKTTSFDMSLDEFVDKNYGMVITVARRFNEAVSAIKSMTEEDIVQLGALGLVNTYYTYDESLGTALSTWAYKNIEYEILRGFRHYDTEGGVKFSRTSKELARTYFFRLDDYDQLTPEYIAEVKEKTGVSDYIMNTAVDYFYHSMKAHVALDRSVSEDAEDSIIDRMCLPDNCFDTVDGELREFMLTLNEREKIIITGMANGESQANIGKKCGISQVQVSRIRRKIKQKFKEYIGCD